MHCHKPPCVECFKRISISKNTPNFKWIRWLHPISIPELYEMYETHHQGQAVSSVSVFRAELKKWRSVLKIRQVGQPRCMTCTLHPLIRGLLLPTYLENIRRNHTSHLLSASGSRLSEWRRASRTAEDRTKVQLAKTDHLARVFADRSCARRLMVTSEAATNPDPRVPPERGLLYVSIDGMDQVPSLHFLQPGKDYWKIINIGLQVATPDLRPNIECRGT